MAQRGREPKAWPEPRGQMQNGVQNPDDPLPQSCQALAYASTGCTVVACRVLGECGECALRVCAHCVMCVVCAVTGVCCSWLLPVRVAEHLLLLFEYRSLLKAHYKPLLGQQGVYNLSPLPPEAYRGEYDLVRSSHAIAPGSGPAGKTRPVSDRRCASCQVSCVSGSTRGEGQPSTACAYGRSTASTQRASSASSGSHRRTYNPPASYFAACETVRKCRCFGSPPAPAK